MSFFPSGSHWKCNYSKSKAWEMLFNVQGKQINYLFHQQLHWGVKILELTYLIFPPSACLQQNKVELAVKYFKKAINAEIASEGEMAPELINLYKKIARTEQLNKNNEKSIEYLLQVRIIIKSLQTIKTYLMVLRIVLSGCLCFNLMTGHTLFML